MSLMSNADPIHTANATPEATPEAAERVESPGTPNTPWYRIRQGLDTLVTLSTQCLSAAGQADEDRDYQIKVASDKHQRITDRLTSRRRRFGRTLEEKAVDQKQQLQAQLEVEAEQLKTHYQTRLKQRVTELKDREAKLKQQRSEALWLAESKREAIAKQLSDEKKAAKKLAEQQRAEVQVIRDRLTKRLKAYGMLSLSKQDEPKRDEHKRERGKQEEAELEEADAAVEANAVTAEDFNQQRSESEKTLSRFERLLIPSLLVGTIPYFVTALFVLLAGIIAAIVTTVQAGSAAEPIAFEIIGIASGSALIVSIIVWVMMRIAAKRKVTEAYEPMIQGLVEAEGLVEDQLQHKKLQREQIAHDADEAQAASIAKAKDKFDMIITNAEQALKNESEQIQTEFQQKKQDQQADHDKQRADDTQAATSAVQLFNERYDRRQSLADARRDRFINEVTETWQAAQEAIDARWAAGRQQIEDALNEAQTLHDQRFQSWSSSDHNWLTWQPSVKDPNVKEPRLASFGKLFLNTQKWTTGEAASNRFKLDLPAQVQIPALIGGPDRFSMLIHAARDQRDRGLALLQSVMLRLLTELPPGRVRFNLLDPVGLGQSFAGFMHLADYDEALVGQRIYSEPDDIERRLIDLTEHMENVIQKYLRNDFATIDEYNEQAGELAEPYRFLVVADFPSGFSEESLMRLSSIASSGPRCGVYLLLLRDTRQRLELPTALDDLARACVNVMLNPDKPAINDQVLGRFDLTLDEPPSEALMTRLVQQVGEGALNANRVEVDFEVIAPEADALWSRDCAQEFVVPMGRSGATRLQSFGLGKGVAQHSLIAGKTGSGKSTLLHILITNAALWYSPDEVEFYLIDFKKGVEFKAYADLNLPHARAIAIESDREFGLSVLQRIDDEMTRRGEAFRKVGVQNLADYRQQTGEALPRTILIVDEFQEFFNEDDKIAQDANLLLDRLVRQGRAFGVHVVLGSQSLGGAGGLARSTMGQMAVRIALQCNEADSQLILNDDNTAARLLTRPGEAIYNDMSGMTEGNSPFQVAWLNDAQRDPKLQTVADRYAQTEQTLAAPIVFEGNAPAEVSTNEVLTAWSNEPAWPQLGSKVHAFVGAPVAIKTSTHFTLERLSGHNLLIIGQNDEAALAMTSTLLASLVYQHPATGDTAAKFIVMDGTPSDAEHAGYLDNLLNALPHETESVNYREVEPALANLHEELTARQAAADSNDDNTTAPAIYLIVHGLQRYRMLRQQEESFSFSLDDDTTAPAQPDKQFADLIQEGPAHGIHVLTWCDAPVSLERTLDRSSLREFDHRILFQMSANDSSNLIDSTAANHLGPYKALLFSEAEGTLERFRPYAIPDTAWITQLQQSLTQRPQ